MDEKELRALVRQVAEEMRGNIVVADFAIAVAHRAVAAEREACAKVCDGFVDTFEANRGYGPEMCGEAIRARSNAEVSR